MLVSTNVLKTATGLKSICNRNSKIFLTAVLLVQCLFFSAQAQNLVNVTNTTSGGAGVTGTYTVSGGLAYKVRMTAKGAKGGTANNAQDQIGGDGAVIVGEFYLSSGQSIEYVAGSTGQNYTYIRTGGAGGGGGSGVRIKNASIPLILAGGGGGGGEIAAGGTSNASGGTGNGGNGSNSGAGGGGLNSAGGYGLSYRNGGGAGFNASGGNNGAVSGGGGYCGGGCSYYGGGGGGGYTGGDGGGGNINGYNGIGGGGGTSFNTGANQSNNATTNAGGGAISVDIVSTLLASGTVYQPNCSSPNYGSITINITGVYTNNVLDLAYPNFEYAIVAGNSFSGSPSYIPLNSAPSSVTVTLATGDYTFRVRPRNSPQFYMEGTFTILPYVAGIHIPDPNFAAALHSMYPSVIDACDNLTAAAATLTNVSPIGKSISDLTGIEGFTKVTYINCSNNPLGTLPKFPASLLTLYCTGDALTSIPSSSLPSGLQYLDCSNNSLTTLPTLPTTLGGLTCYFNNITCLPTLPPSLRNLSLDASKISCLPNAVSGLNVYNYGSNRPTAFPVCTISTPIANVTQPTCALPTGTITIITPVGAGYTYSLDGGVATSATSFTSVATSVHSVVAYGNCATSTATSVTVNAVQVSNGIHIPDANFAAAISSQCPTCIDACNNLTSAAGSLTSLFVGSKSISDLTGIGGFTSLVTLFCNNNNLTSLPALPNSIKDLECQNNQLTLLPALLPTSLDRFYCDNNNLTSLPSLPPGMTSVLSCVGNKIPSLPTLPPNLQNIFCTGNLIATLPALPNALQTLRCSGNLITSLPTLPNFLSILQIDYPQISCLPNKPTFLNVITNASGVNITSVIKLCCTAPTITAQTAPTTQTVCHGGNTTDLSVASSDPTASYQWYSNTTNSNSGGTIIIKAVAPNYTPSSTIDGTTYYYCVVTANCGSSTASNPVVVNVNQVALTPLISGSNTVGQCSTITLNAQPTGGTWSSNSTNATISSTGIVSGISIGQATISYSYTASNGCIGTVGFTLNVTPDVTPPVKPTLADVNAECLVASLTAPTTTDNCTGIVTGTTSTVFPITTQGTTIVTWTFADGNGNSTTATQNVIVKDVTAPVKPTLTDVTAECSATPAVPKTTDNCAGTVTGTTSTVFPITTQGTTIVTWTFADGNGNSVTANQNVIIKDVTAPVKPTLTDVTAECSVASIAAPTTTDNCAGTISGTTPIVFPITTQGTTIVTWTFDDGNGNSVTANQNVIIKDVTAPVKPTLADVTAECSVASIAAPTTTDNCAGTITGTTPIVFPITTQGTTIVTWTFDDGNGNSVTANQNVIIKDVTAPVKPTLTDVTAECSATPTAPTTTDNCAGTVTGTTSTVFPITKQGTTIVTWTFADGNGNSTTATQNVIIKDVTPPVQPILANVTAECSVASIAAPKTTDNCAGTITGTTSTVFPITKQGTTIVTWTFADGNGNSTTSTQNVIIKDVTPPVQPILTDVTAECSASPIAPTTTDNCAGTITGTTSTVFPITTQGTTIVTWTFADGNGNSTTATQNVIIKDITPPVKPTLADVTAECLATPIVPKTTDNCAGTVTGTTSTVFPITTQGTTIVTWTFADGNGNSTTATQNVIIKDITPPVKPTLADVTAECLATPIVPKTTDNCAGTVTGTTSTVFPITTQGTTIVTWTFADGNGNSTTETQNVIIKDVTPPVQPILTNITAECSVASIAAPTTTDNCAGTITGTTSTVFPIIKQGTTIVTWTFADGNGNSTTATQNVIIKDVTPPVQPILANVTAECSATPTAPTTTDNCAGTITGTPTLRTRPGATSIFPITTQGTTIVTWTFADGNGNSTTATQNVIIKDVTPPVQPILANVTAECSVASIAAPTTTDNCAGTITGTTSTVFPITKQGTTIVTWTFADGNGNLTTATQNVIIKDVTPPVQPILADVTAECSAIPTAPTTTDNCAGTITGTPTLRTRPGATSIFPITTQGTTIVTWTFSDGNGNLTTATQNVIIKDVTPPVQPTLANVTAECSATPTAPTTTDNCAGTVTGTTSTVFPIIKQGITIVTWTFADGNGNSTTATQNVIIKDVTPPVQPTLANITAECSVASIAALTTTDNCAGTITGTTSTVFPITKQGTTIVTWTFSDGNGNSTTATQNVIIKDVTPPVQPILSNVTAECSVASIAAPTTTDNCAGTITGTTSTVFPITKQGTTIVTWTFADGNGNSTTATQNVIIKDVTPPVQPTLANVTAECSVASIAAPTTTDNCAGTITGTTSTVFPITNQGTTVVTWTFTDGNGNSTTATQNVIIKDVTPPVQPTLVNVTAECSVPSIAAPTTTDNCAGTITGTTSTIFPITKQGTTIVTWNFSDGNGNSTTATQNVIIKDVTPPVQPTLANVTAECSVAYIAAPKTLDNCAGTVTGTTSTVFPISKQGTTIVTWNFSDGNGNSTTATQNVIIKDVTPPVQPILTNVTAECSVASIAAPTTTDNCAGTITGTTSTVFPITKQGTTIVTWTFADGNGNSTTATQNVILKDVTKPTIACPTTPSPVNNTDAGICGAKVTFANATATDNCTPSSGIKIGSTPISGSVFSVGNTQVTFTATDLAGNFSTCSFTVSVSSKAAFDPSVCYNILNNGKPIVLDGDNAQIYSAKQTKVQSFKMIALSNGNIQILSSSDKNAKKSFSDDAPKGDLKVNVKDYKSDGQSDWQINCVNGAYVITHQASGQVLTVGVAQNDGKIPVVLSGASGGANSSQTWTFQAVACPVLDNSLQSRNESDTRAYADGTRNTVQFTTKNGNTMHTLTAEKQNATTGVFEDFEEHNTDELTDKIQSHTFYDNTPTGGINVYRVKTVYYNGVVEYSSQKLVNRKSNSDFIVYPNPAKGEATIILDQTENQDLHLEVINTLGKTMFTDVIQTTTSSTYRLDVSNYASGLYFIKLQTPDSQILTQKLQVAK